MPKRLTLTSKPSPPSARSSSAKPTVSSPRAARSARAAGTPAYAATSPLARLQPVLERFDAAKAPSREVFLSRHPDPVVGKDGIEFGGTLWWNAALRRHTSVPPASKAKRPILELRYDAAALSRGELQEVLLVVLDAHGTVAKRVRCHLRGQAQQQASRDEERAEQIRYERELRERRTQLERRAGVELAGRGVGPVLDTLAAARDRQGRPNEARTGGVRRAAAPAPAAGGAATGAGTPSSSPSDATAASRSSRTRPTAAPPMKGKKAAKSTSTSKAPRLAAGAKGAMTSPATRRVTPRASQSTSPSRDARQVRAESTAAAPDARTPFNAFDALLARLAARKGDASL